MKFGWMTALVVAVLGCGRAAAGACLGDSAQARFLPRVIGRPYSNLRSPYRMPCDTMEVRIGDTCTIYPGTMMHFGSSSRQDNRILVRGRLEVLGSEEAPVNFSGTLGEGDFGLKPGAGPWGGILVDPVGEVYLRNVRIFKSTPILHSQSESIVFSKVLTKLSLDLVGPNGRYYPVDFKETRIDTLDFGAPQKAVAVSSPATDSGAVVKPTSGKSNALTWSLLGGGALLIGGGAWWYLSDHGSGGQGPVPETTRYPQRPSFPGATP